MTINRRQEMVALYYQLGGALSQWANVERAIYQAVSAVFENKDLQRESLGLAYFSLETFRAKLSFADKAVERKLRGSSHAEDWKKLVARAHSLSQSRNKLAHWQVDVYPEESPGQRVVLRAWINNKVKREPGAPKKRPKGSLTTRDIGKLAMEFLSLAVAIRNFTYRAGGLAEPHPKESETAPTPPPTAQLVKLIRRELESREDDDNLVGTQDADAS